MRRTAGIVLAFLGTLLAGGVSPAQMGDHPLPGLTGRVIDHAGGLSTVRYDTVDRVSKTLDEETGASIGGDSASGRW